MNTEKGMTLLYCIIAGILLFIAIARYVFYRAGKECERTLEYLREAMREREAAAGEYLDVVERYPLSEKEMIRHLRHMLAWPDRQKNIITEISMESAVGILMKGLCIHVDAYPYIFENTVYQEKRGMMQIAMGKVRAAAKKYNETAAAYNRLRNRFGFNFVAEGFRLEAMPVYESEEELVSDFKVVF